MIQRLAALILASGLVYAGIANVHADVTSTGLVETALPWNDSVFASIGESETGSLKIADGSQVSCAPCKDSKFGAAHGAHG